MTQATSSFIPEQDHIFIFWLHVTDKPTQQQAELPHMCPSHHQVKGNLCLDRTKHLPHTFRHTFRHSRSHREVFHGEMQDHSLGGLLYMVKGTVQHSHRKVSPEVIRRSSMERCEIIAWKDWYYCTLCEGTVQHSRCRVSPEAIEKLSWRDGRT